MLDKYKERVRQELARKKRMTPEKLLADKAEQLAREFGHWRYISKNGCSDPFWPDGTNMNLTRSHIIVLKKEIQAINSLYRTGFPEVYYLETPQEVPDQYMATLEAESEHGKKRIERLWAFGNPLIKGEPPEIDPQLTFL